MCVLPFSKFESFARQSLQKCKPLGPVRPKICDIHIQSPPKIKRQLLNLQQYAYVHMYMFSQVQVQSRRAKFAVSWIFLLIFKIKTDAVG